MWGRGKRRRSHQREKCPKEEQAGPAGAVMGNTCVVLTLVLTLLLWPHVPPFTAILEGSDYYYPHFIDELTEAQSSQVIFPGAHNRQVADLGFEPSSPAAESRVLTTHHSASRNKKNYSVRWHRIFCSVGLVSFLLCGQAIMFNFKFDQVPHSQLFGK